MKDSIEVRHPGGNRAFIVPRVENTRDSILFAQLDDTPLDLRNSPAIGDGMSKSGAMGVSTGATHVVNCSIASNTDLVN